ncbi:DUF5106 domain-containing protein [uncultured Proteiniphilum sp.]|uniref:DUF5106 domain-containing protein n=1 Tax=uncultured Proteiniphilum sp. TaxID=497637 RepID=UPI0026240E26|nr:DUF5106 domain-containing protein [uncultured Proteiniphilum sp.]
MANIESGKMFKKSLGEYDLIEIGRLRVLFTVGLLVIFAVICFSSCTRRNDVVNPLANENPDETVIPALKDFFSLPVIPLTITDKDETFFYLAMHWWDYFNFPDTVYTHIPEEMEQVFVGFLDILPLIDASKASKAINNLLSKAEQEESGRVYRYFLEQAEKYLYNPNSPMLNEELYAAVVGYILQDACSNETEKIRPAFQLEEINKNRKGMVAADFIYMLANGKKGRLHNISAKYTLLLFYNPDCSACKQTKEILENSDIITTLTKTGMLKVLAFYPDEDLETWRMHQMVLPENWINACDGSDSLIVKKSLYAIRAIPSLYLLDKDKRVLLKDGTAEQVIKELMVSTSN